MLFSSANAFSVEAAITTLIGSGMLMLYLAPCSSKKLVHWTTGAKVCFRCTGVKRVFVHLELESSLLDKYDSFALRQPSGSWVKGFMPNVFALADTPAKPISKIPPIVPKRKVKLLWE